MTRNIFSREILQIHGSCLKKREEETKSEIEEKDIERPTGSIKQINYILITTVTTPSQPQIDRYEHTRTPLKGSIFSKCTSTRIGNRETVLYGPLKFRIPASKA
jgi:hypothetical protein